jgi:hypothetical protein
MPRQTVRRGNGGDFMELIPRIVALEGALWLEQGVNACKRVERKRESRDLAKLMQEVVALGNVPGRPP